MADLEYPKPIYLCSKVPKAAEIKYYLNEIAPKLDVVTIDPDKAGETTECWNKEILLSDGFLATKFLFQPSERFAFIQGTFAGVDFILEYMSKTNKRFPKVEYLRFATAKYPLQFAEYMIGQAISSERRFHHLRQAQSEEKWLHKPGETNREVRVFCELTVGILGVGEMGRETARIFKSFHAKTRGLVRTMPENPEEKCPHIDQFYSMDNVGEMIEGCDYLCGALPHTNETKDLLGGGVLKNCEGYNTCLINAGRGSLISDDDILEALDKGWIREAILDAFNIEPLPKNHPFWQHPKIIATPHVSALARPQDTAVCFCENLALYLKGKLDESKCKVDWTKSY